METPRLKLNDWRSSAPAIASGALCAFLALELGLRESPPGFPAIATMMILGLVAGVLAHIVGLVRYLTACALLLLVAWFVLSFTPIVGRFTRD